MALVSSKDVASLPPIESVKNIPEIEKFVEHKHKIIAKIHTGLRVVLRYEEEAEKETKKAEHDDKEAMFA